jgi:hypothetical protein
MCLRELSPVERLMAAGAKIQDLQWPQLLVSKTACGPVFFPLFTFGFLHDQASDLTFVFPSGPLLPLPFLSRRQSTVHSFTEASIAV